MKRILIVEDDEDKADRLKEYVLDFPVAHEVEVARSLQSGLRAALGNDFELILLDMTMTNFDRTLQDDGGRPHHFAGREILRQLRREGVSVPVVIITQFDRFGEDDEALTLEQLEEDLRAKFPDFLGVVRYRSNVDDWKSQLQTYFQEVLGKSGGSNASSANH